MLNRIISIDFETYLISADMTIPKPVCLSYFDGTNKGLLVGMPEMEVYLRKILYQGYTIIAHNMKFEALVIYEYFPRLRKLLWNAIYKGKLYCSKIYEKLLNNIRRKQVFNVTLSQLVKNYFEEDISESKSDPDAWRLRYNELDGVPKKDWPQEAVDYAIEDSVWAYKIYQVQTNIKVKWQDAVKTEICLNLMGQSGILVDNERAKTLEKELKDLLAPNYKILLESEYARVDKKTKKIIKNMKKLREYINENVKNKEYTEKGAISTSSISLVNYVAEKPDKILQAFLDVHKYEKILTAFVPDLLAANPYIRSEYNAVVSSGRTSSTKSRNYPSVNIQQMPRQVPDVTWDVRNCFVPRPGYKIVSIDYNGLELASTAHMLYKTFGKSAMRDTINSGDVPVDMHSKLATRLMSLKTGSKPDYDNFIKHKKEPEYKHFRQLSKPINLGFPGGIGYDTMRDLLAKEGIFPRLTVLMRSESEQDLKRILFNYRFKYPYIRIRRLNKTEYGLVYDELIKIKEELFKLYPELEKFLKEGHERFKTGETLPMKNEYGEWEREDMYRFEYMGVKRDYCTYTALCNNYLMQSPSAIGAKAMTVKVVETYFEHPEVNPLAFIHDEIVFEVKDNENMYKHVEDIAEIMINEMQKVLTSVRIAVEAEIMPYWMKSGGEWSRTYFKDSISKPLRHT
jgi:DNA polymerase I-like protein with 3'-5' exonuclease and polymerase domains